MRRTLIVFMLLLLPLPVAAQVASSPRLRLVVRTPEGLGVAGVGVRLYQFDELLLPKLVLETTTTEQGILDLDATSLQVGDYQVRLTKGASSYEVVSEVQQQVALPPLEFHLGRTGDEWVMLVLYPNGKVGADYSYTLARRPQPYPALMPTRAPLSWAQVLASRGLPTVMPRPWGDVAVANEPAATRGQPQAAPLPGVAAPANGTDNSPEWWLLVGLAFILLLWFGGRWLTSRLTTNSWAASRVVAHPTKQRKTKRR